MSDEIEHNRSIAPAGAAASGAPSPPAWRRAGKLILFAAAMAAIVILPFVLFGDALSALSRDVMADPSSRIAAAAAAALLLAADVLLPVPSTIVIALLGALIGAVGATLVATAGLTAGCIAGFALGRRLGQGFAERTMGARDFAYLSGLFERYGVLALAVCRPVPVLAEASVIAAGVAGMTAPKVVVTTTVANVGFAAVYATLGAAADTTMGLAVAVAASTALPFAAMLAVWAVRRRRL